MVENQPWIIMSPDTKNRMNSNKSFKETIHSGHFMVSVIDEVEGQLIEMTLSSAVHESDCDQETLSVSEYDFEIECQETSKTYTFGPRSSQSISIDDSLTKLLECMSLAYHGAKLTSPRWKTFKGLRLRLKDKIRLNNIIWRTWHIQFVAKKKPTVCQFSSPLEIDHPFLPEAVVVEGKYWKRKLSTVTAEYKKWRLYYKDRSRSIQPIETEQMELDFNWPSPNNSFLEDAYTEFDNALFNNWLPIQQYDIPNPKEIAAKAGIAEFIQPGLGQLQPSFDDFMDSFQSLHDFLPTKLAPVSEEISDYLPSSSLPPQQQNQFGQSDISNNYSSFPDDPTADQLGLTSNSFINPSDSSLLLDSMLCEPQIPETVSVSPSITSPHMRMPPSTQISTTLRQQNNRHNNNYSSGKTTHHSGGSDQSSSSVKTRRALQKKVLSNRSSSGGGSGTMTSSPTPNMGNHHQPDLMSQVLLAPKPPPQPLMPKPDGNNFVAIQNNLHLGNLHYSNSGNKPSQMLMSQQESVPSSFIPCHMGNMATSFTMQDLGRRNSYSSPNQQYKSEQIGSGNASGSSSVKVAPATATNNFGRNSNNFMVPEAPLKPRVRSRSVSTPQSNTNFSTTKPAAPTQAVSLTNLSSNPKNLLSQLLTSSTPHIGCSSSPATTVTFLNGLPTQTQTLVLSPLITTVSNVNELQTGMLIGRTAANQVFNIAPSPIVSTTSNLIAPTSPQLLPQPTSLNNPSPIATPSPESNINSGPTKAFRPKSCEERVQYKEHRRVCHINAEQKRRFNIKSGFETIRHIVPYLSQSPASKVSKAAMLQRAGDYIRALKNDRVQQNEEMNALKTEIEDLKKAISVYQGQLPASGAPLNTGQPSERLQEMYRNYVRAQSLNNWKFWIFSLILNPLLESYSRAVYNTNIEEYCKSVMTWVDQHCSLNFLRPMVSQALTTLSTSTNIIDDPASLPLEITQQITKQEF